MYNDDGSFNPVTILHNIIDSNTFIKIERPDHPHETASFEITFPNMVCTLYKSGYIIEVDGDVISGLKFLADFIKKCGLSSKLYLNTHGVIIPSNEYEIVNPIDLRTLANHIDKLNQYDLVSKLLEDTE